jgi:hypothetical protein
VVAGRSSGRHQTTNAVHDHQCIDGLNPNDFTSVANHVAGFFSRTQLAMDRMEWMDWMLDDDGGHTVV